MRIIEKLLATNDFVLHVKFSTGEEKSFDMKQYFKYPAFEPLSNIEVFRQATNKKYFIEWNIIEVDLSADTIWHEGVSVSVIKI